MKDEKDLLNKTKSNVQEESFQWRALNDIPSCVFVLSNNGTVVFANEVAQNIMELDSYIGKQFEDYFAKCPNSANDHFYDTVLSAVNDVNTKHHGRCLFVSEDGTRYAFFVTSSYLKHQNGESYLVVTCTDITAEEKAERNRHESTFLLIATILYICTFMFIYATWNYLGQPGNKSDLTRLIEVGGPILGFLAFRYTSFIPKDLGLGFKNIRHILLVDGLASVAIVAVFSVLKFVLMQAASGLIKHPEASCSSVC